MVKRYKIGFRVDINDDGLNCLWDSGEVVSAADYDRACTLLRMVAAHLMSPHIGGMSGEQQAAILEWYESENTSPEKPAGPDGNYTDSIDVPESFAPGKKT